MIYRYLILFTIINQISFSQNAYEIVKKSYQQFQQIKSYSADVQFLFDIPKVNIKDIKGKAYYKATDKYRVKLDGIAFVPNENPMKIYNYLSDPQKYQALTNASETIQNQKCHIVNIIPNESEEFILGKLWISSVNHCPLKVEFTTSRGSITIENFFKTMTKYGIPDKSIFFLNHIKPPKEKGLGPKKELSEKDKKASITLIYSNYQINIPIADSLFKKPPIKKKD